MTGNTLNMIVDFIKQFAYDWKFQASGIEYCIYCSEPSHKGKPIIHSVSCFVVKANEILKLMDAEGI